MICKITRSQAKGPVPLHPGTANNLQKQGDSLRFFTWQKLELFLADQLRYVAKKARFNLFMREGR
jgi:hypothetical protein